MLSFYRHADWVGSSRLASTPSRGVYYDGAYAPYGESYAEMGTTDHVFTGQAQDTVGDLYDFPFRDYHPIQGRWVSPDPVGGDITNPQSLNRYAYVLNSPTNLIDPLGLQPDDDYGDCDPWSDPQCPDPCDPSLDALCQPPPCYVIFGPGCNGPGPAAGSPDWGTAGSTTGGSPPDEAWLGYPCNPSLSYLINEITIGLTNLFGKGTVKGQITTVLVQGGAQVFSVPDITPTKDFETDWPKLRMPGTGPGRYQIYYPVPGKSTGGTSGAGDVLHVEFNTVTNAAGQVTKVTGVSAHFDISNPMNGHGIGLPGHLLFDWGFARISQALCGGGAVKFQ